MFLNLTLGYLLFTALYVACFALGLTVCGLYGQDLTSAREAGVGPDTKWASQTPSFSCRWKVTLKPD